MVPMRAILLLVVMTLQSFAAIYYVSTTGNDSNPGTQASPWRTIQQGANRAVAGDTVVVLAGDYGEYVRTRANGAPGAPITFRADPPNDPRAQVVLRQFRVMHPHNVFEGFNLTRPQNALASYVRIEAAADHTVVRNCTIRDGVFWTGRAAINTTANSLSAPGAAWASRGFEPGTTFYIGACSLPDYVFNNHDSVWTVASISGDTMYVTGSFQSEASPTAWMPVFVGANRNGITGIEWIISGGTSASHCTIADNTISNIWGHALLVNGQHHEIVGNTFTELHSYAGMKVSGGEHRIHENLWLNCTNFIHYSTHESDDIPHPAGTGWYDYVVGFIHSTVNEVTQGSNTYFFRNWIQNSDNPLGQISEPLTSDAHSYGFYVRSNVFVGLASSLNGGRNGLSVENNTFYRISFDEERAHAVTIGGNLPETPATNIYVRHNVFVDVGSHRSLDNEGYYGVVNTVDSEVDHNFVAGPETTGYSSKRWFDEPNGVNGGDPLFQDVGDPLGPDGKPFTADDGLRPLPDSPLAVKGLGALAPVAVTVGTPIGHFSISELSSGLTWHDATGTDFDPPWTLLAPFERTSKVRPWDTPEALGHAPVTVTFNATGSISGQAVGSTDWEGITSFIWNFGDGSFVTTSQPTVTHTYTSTGAVRVTLTVTNGAGQADAVSRTYRILGGTGDSAPTPPSGLRVVDP